MREKTAILRRIAIALVLALLALPATGQDFQKGLAAAMRGDYATVLREWRPLAEQGDVKAQYNLGFMYQLGQGVLQDYGEAAKWYRKAAEQGSFTAMSYLGGMYVEGKGVPQNFVLAHMWFSIFVDVGQVSLSDRARTARKRHRIAMRMSPAQIAKAQKLAREWREKHKKK